MKQLIACCGLDCENCAARIATVNNDDELREKTAKEWSVLNNTPEITPETIHCILYGVPCRRGEVCLLQRLLCYPQMCVRKRFQYLRRL